MTAPLNTFERDLLVALREHVEDRAPAAADQAPHGTPRVRRPRLLLSAAAVVLLAVAGVVVVPGLGSTPAYSVQEGNAGTIEVEVNRFEDADGLERALAEHGIDAEITYVPDGGACAPGRYVPLERQGISLEVGVERFRVVLDPGTIREGDTLVIDASLVLLPDHTDPETGIESTGGFRATVDAEVARGPVPPCTPVG